jgi:prevent-host-death family protein
MQSWQLQEAKARMSELIKSTQDQPQQITVHGKPVAVVLSASQYEALANSQLSLVDFLQRSPLFDSEELVLEREHGFSRDVEL